MGYEKKDFRKLYEDLVKSDWFKRAYHDKSLGECPFDIPELNESEDEKIRKDLIGGIMWQRDNLDRLGKHDDSLILPGFCRTVGEHLAYLEKQKEQKPLPPFDELTPEEKMNHPLYLEGFDVGRNVQKVFDEQKPVEYLSKDKVYAIMNKLTVLSLSELIPLNSDEYKKIHEITFDVRSLLDYPIEQKPRWEINNPHTTKWTKEMIDEKFEELVEEYHKQKPVVTHGETYHVDTLGTQQVIAGKMPQKPAEWSEEEKGILLECISVLQSSSHWLLADKLKSLRPQPHWKPSEEQEEPEYYQHFDPDC